MGATHRHGLGGAESNEEARRDTLYDYSVAGKLVLMYCIVNLQTSRIKSRHTRWTEPLGRCESVREDLVGGSACMPVWQVPEW
jgi:hypothetical protein